ncbi:MAG: type II toxin-antitoxin system VapC family toxin [Propionibacteriaceae bacterium]|nr:type II toxin-antitoxin system VapC family toxin [Propionibacteriaceae bacterium]
MDGTYFDTSALAKLVRTEDGSAQTAELWEHSRGSAVSSELTITELRRTVRSESEMVRAKADEVLNLLYLIPLDRMIIEAAARLNPQILRTLDALHLASALALEENLIGLVTYDTRMADAARLYGIPVKP